MIANPDLMARNGERSAKEDGTVYLLPVFPAHRSSIPSPWSPVPAENLIRRGMSARMGYDAR